jgi:hypothetical protein
VAGEARGLGRVAPVRERDRDERVPEVVQADRLEAVAVQPDRVAYPVKRAERVPARLRLAPRRREDERVGADEGEAPARLPRAVRE